MSQFHFQVSFQDAAHRAGGALDTLGTAGVANREGDGTERVPFDEVGCWC